MQFNHHYCINNKHDQIQLLPLKQQFSHFAYQIQQVHQTTLRFCQFAIKQFIKTQKHQKHQKEINQNDKIQQLEIELYNKTQCVPESLIIAAKYLSQIITYNLNCNYFVLITASIVLAEIMVDDSWFVSHYYAYVAGINYQEMMYVIEYTLQQNDYQIYVTASDYRQWYYKLFKQ